MVTKKRKDRDPPVNIERKNVQINRFRREIKLLLTTLKGLNASRKGAVQKHYEDKAIVEIFVGNSEYCDFCCGAVVAHAGGQHTRV